jgi:predicted AAA+ superfamily ATPase
VFLDYKQSVTDFMFTKAEEVIPPVFEQEFAMQFQEYLLFGGFPAVVKEEEDAIKTELLKNLTRTYLEKDIFFFLNIRHLDKFKQLLYYLSFNTGSLLEVSSIMRELHMDYKTVENYLTILANTYLISLVSPFFRNLTTELKKSKKIYFTDSGLRNSVINNFLPLESRTDRGTLLENFIFNELTRTVEGRLHYWRTTGKAEVDFILHSGHDLIPIEVKSQARLSKSYLSFLKTYKPKRGVVFATREFGIKKIEMTKVMFVPHFYI